MVNIIARHDTNNCTEDIDTLCERQRKTIIQLHNALSCRFVILTKVELLMVFEPTEPLISILHTK